MKKRIVVCADGTWNRPEQDLEKEFPTNVLKLARAISPVGQDGVPQQVFYDWGIGSYHSGVVAGATGKGLHKNVMDDYRYIVQNYKPGDEIYLFGFSRGSYTIRSLCGMINNSGILRRPNARLIQQAFDLYKRRGKVNAPRGRNSVAFRQKYAHESRQIKFVGVWDTVGAMGIPFSFLGLFEDKDEFYDAKLGSNVSIARHALAIDEHRQDFLPTIWNEKPGNDLQQVWFAGAHSNVGGSHKPDRDGSLASDLPLEWMLGEAQDLSIERHIEPDTRRGAKASLHNSRRSFYRIRRKMEREIDHGQGQVILHESVKKRWNQRSGDYRPENLSAYLDSVGGWANATVMASRPPNYR